MVNIAILGYGTVGSGIAEVIEKNKVEINKKADNEINVKYILDIRSFPGDPHENKITRDIDMILSDPEIAIVCETMGGLHPAYEYTKRALEAGKSVCTSNKELVSEHGPEFLSIAKEKKCNYLFEASVGGGIPIIRPLNYSLTAEKIERICGILNGTTNYILTQMEKEGIEFSKALAEAQERGYAEQDPRADIEGHDAARKIAILSSLMTGKNVRYAGVYTEGIENITAMDFKYAKAQGMTIKLIAKSRVGEGGKLQIIVAPFMLEKSHPLCFVTGVNNAVFVRSNMLGDSMYYGRGAGKLPTASAVVSDVVDCARHLGKTIMCFWDAEDIEIDKLDHRAGKFFVRVADTPANDAKLSEVFPDYVPLAIDVAKGECAFTCGPMSEETFREKTALLPGGIISRIRLEDSMKSAGLE